MVRARSSHDAARAALAALLDQRAICSGGADARRTMPSAIADGSSRVTIPASAPETRLACSTQSVTSSGRPYDR